MNNNTKIRLRLSKNLFESITREILAEAKINGGGAYTVAVKTSKVGKIKEVNAVADTDKMEKMEEGPKKKKGHNADTLKKAKAAIEKRLAEMEDNVAEDKIEESVKKRKLKR